jgi:hypothetical protein
MKTRVLVIVMSFGLHTQAAFAATYACQFLKDGGLHWSGSDWVLRGFNTDPHFFLKTAGTRVTPESAALASGSPSLVMHCHESVQSRPNLAVCINGAGRALVFDSGSSKGAFSSMIGSTGNGDKRDSLSVAPFTCQKMGE